MAKKIKPIQYSCVQTNPETDNNNTKYVHPDYESNSDELITSVNIDPKKFVNHITNPLNHTKDNWFINLTDTTIPPSISVLLQLWDNFCLSSDSCKKTVIHEFY